MIEQKSKVIGTTKYLVTMLDGFTSLNIQAKLIKLLGPAALPIFFGGTPELTKKVLAELVTGLASNFDDKEFVDLVMLLFEKNVFVEKQNVSIPIDFTNHFSGKPAEMWKVLFFILEVNFGLGKYIKSVSPITKEAEQTKESSM